MKCHLSASLILSTSEISLPFLKICVIYYTTNHKEHAAFPLPVKHNTNISAILSLVFRLTTTVPPQIKLINRLQLDRESFHILQKLTAFSFLFCLIMLDRTLARDWPSLSSRYAGTAPSGVLSSSFCLDLLCSCILILQAKQNRVRLVTITCVHKWLSS